VTGPAPVFWDYDVDGWNRFSCTHQIEWLKSHQKVRETYDQDKKMSETVSLFSTKYRVLVLKNAGAKHPHQRVNAICLERNLVGRGANLPQALLDLSKVLHEDIRYEWEELAPSPREDPDPELLRVFDGGLPSAGEVVLARLWVFFEAGLLKSPGPKKGGQRGRASLPCSKPKVRFEPCHA
jgi:hypothetical protein